jgi:hypothetical protein
LRSLNFARARLACDPQLMATAFERSLVIDHVIEPFERDRTLLRELV